MGRVKPSVKDSQAEAVLSSQLQAAVRGTMTVKPGETIPPGASREELRLPRGWRNPDACRASRELFEQIRREYEFGIGTIAGVAKS